MPDDGDLVDLLTRYAPDEATRNRILVENSRDAVRFWTWRGLIPIGVESILLATYRRDALVGRYTSVCPSLARGCSRSPRWSA